jgi:IS605 OrfB family transposase
MAVSVTRTVIAAYKSVRTNQRQHSGRFSKKKRHIDIKPSFRVPQLSLVWNRDYSLIKNTDKTERLFSVNTLRGRIKCPFRADSMDWAFDEGAVYGTAKLIFRHGKFFLYVPVTINVPDTPAPSSCKKVVGIDRGIRFLAAACDGKKTSFYSGAAVKQKRAHYKELRRQLQKRQTSSARRRIRAIGQRENRWMNDVNHRISKALVCAHPKGTLFVLEDLTGIRGASERVRVKDRYTQVSWAYYDLEQKIMYKAVRCGSALLKVDPAYTSQTCPICGHVDRASRKHETHTFKCTACGYTTNDDRIGAMNLQRMGTEYLLKAQVSNI